MGLNAKQRSFLELLKGTTSGFGKVFFVGLESQTWHSELVSQFSPGSVKGTLSQALSACVSGRGDTVVVLPGTHTQTAALTVSKTCTIMGLPGMTSQTVLNNAGAGATDGSLLTLTAACNVMNLTMHSADTGADEYAIKASAIGINISDCEFNSKEGGTANSGVFVTAGADNLTISGCRFDGTKNGVEIQAAASDGTANITILDCTFADPGVSAITDLAGAVGFSNLLVKNCVFIGDGSADVLLLNAATTDGNGLVVDCYFTHDADALTLPGSNKVQRLGGALGAIAG